MDRIHKKSALPEATPILLAAHDAGATLAWGRYEQQLPLCGFTSNGLNCRKCFEGPCRINPFGDEPTRGVCGADRDQIAMENLFQATLDGVLETSRALHQLGMDEKLPDISGSVGQKVAERLTRSGLLPVRRSDLYAVQNSYFSDKAYLGQTLVDLTRLGLIQYALLQQADSSVPTITPGAVNVLALGQPSREFLAALHTTAQGAGKGLNVYGRADGLLPVADQGSPELALLMNVSALLIAPNAAMPGAAELARQRGIPVICLDGTVSPSEAFSQAARHAAQAAYATSAEIVSHPVPDVVSCATAMADAARSGRIAGIVVLYGEASVKQSFFERTLALMESALVGRVLVVLGGEIEAHAACLNAELGRRKPGLLDAFTTDLGNAMEPVAGIGPSGIPGIVSLLNTPDLQTVPSVFSFPEFFRASTWATAVAVFALGFPVQIGIRLPFWGATPLPTIFEQWGQLTGGNLLTAASVPGPAAQADELLACIKAGGTR